MISIKLDKNRSTPKKLSELDPPELGRTGEYFIHPHTIRKAFIDQLKSLGYRILSEIIATSRGGARITLSTRLSQEASVSRFDYSPSLGMTMGANGRCRITTYSGGVTPEGAAFVIGKQIAPKFSLHFKLDWVADDMVGRFHKHMIAADRCVRNLQTIKVGDATAMNYLLKACGHRWMRYCDISDCYGIWKAGGEDTAWALLRAFSLGIRDSSPFLQLERLYQFSLALYDSRLPHIVGKPL